MVPYLILRSTEFAVFTAWSVGTNLSSKVALSLDTLNSWFIIIVSGINVVGTSWWGGWELKSWALEIFD